MTNIRMTNSKGCEQMNSVVGDEAGQAAGDAADMPLCCHDLSKRFDEGGRQLQAGAAREIRACNCSQKSETSATTCC